jgi:hypothetical protein
VCTFRLNPRVAGQPPASPLSDGGVCAVLGRGEWTLDFHLLVGPKGLTGQMGQRRGRSGALACIRCTGPRRDRAAADGQIAMCRLLSPRQRAELIREVARIVCWGMWGVNQMEDRDVGG